MPALDRRVRRRLKLGIVCDEFFHEDIGGFGGFGWLAREVARLFVDDPSLRTDVVFLGALGAPGRDRASRRPRRSARPLYHGVPAAFLSARRFEALVDVARERVDLLFSVDFRETYQFFFKALPRTPAIFWIQDPRPPSDIEKVATLRVPVASPVGSVAGAGDGPSGDDSVVPASDSMPFACDMRLVMNLTKRFRRPMVPAISAPSLAAKAAPTYGVDLVAPFAYLPYPVVVPDPRTARAPKPRVVYLGRLDPVKRPWVFAAVARQMPDVDFVFLGAARETGPGAWAPEGLPPNLRLAGHLDGEAKDRELAAAWMVVNPSIHEALPVSFIEALAYQLPVVSCQDPEGIASRFGRYVGRWDGTGLEAVPDFCRAIEELVSAPEERAALGAQGRTWAREHHGPVPFLHGLAGAVRRLGIQHDAVEAWSRV